MRLSRIGVVPSPATPGRARLVGDVSYRSLGGRGDRVWLEVDDRFADDLSSSGNPWLALLLPLAVTLREPLRLSLPVDPVLLGGAEEVMRTWSRWYPRLRPVPIEAERADAPAAGEKRRRAAFYSGGIDSLHTIFQDLDESGTAGREPVTDLILVRGFDFARSRGEALAAVQQTATRAAARLGRELVVVETNLRETRFRHADFMDVAHGATLAGVALSLERRYVEVLISAGFSNDTGFPPHGSHPETDPRFSTAATRIVHYGSEVGRVEKTRRVAASELTRDLIRVCWYPRAAGNCGRCPKCIRTKIALELLGELAGCPAFPDASLDLAEVAGFRARHAAEDDFLRENLARAIEAGRPDLARAIESAIANCGRFRRVLRGTTRVGKWLRSHPVFQDSAGERIGNAFGKLVRAVTFTRG